VVLTSHGRPVAIVDSAERLDEDLRRVREATRSVVEAAADMAQRPVHLFFTAIGSISTAHSPRARSCSVHGRFPCGCWHRCLRGGNAGVDLGTGAGVTVVQGLLLALSVVMFIYLGVAMFKPEKF
jgi:K+-transporting ATPase KdpF subunit